MKQRVFVAIELPLQLKESIASWQKQKADLPVRFMSPDTLHLTILPPWYADPKRITTKLRNFSSDVKPFTLHFDTIEKRPRLVWVKGEFSPELTALARSLGLFLHRKLENRLLLPHITLARFKKSVRFAQERVDWSMHVNSFILMKSVLSSKGATCEVLKKFPLTP